MSNAPDPQTAETLLAPFAERLSGFIAGLHTLFDTHLVPGRHPSSFRAFHPHHSFHGDPPQMEHRCAQALHTHVRRLEYMLRAFILWMAGMLVEQAQSDALLAQRLASCAPRRQSHTPLPDEDAPPDWLVKEDQIQKDEALGRVSLPSFSITTPNGLSRASKSSRRRPALRPDPLALIDVPELYARLARLPRILARADDMAERLARKALALPEPASTEPDAPALSPLYFQPLSEWLPPEALYYSTEDETEQADINALHYRAYAVLERLGLRGAEKAAPALPGFRAFKPPDPPVIRSL